MGTYVIKSLGCKANFADGQAIEAELRRHGWRAAGAEQSADLCVVNSCTVTDEADRQSRKLAARLKRLHPGSRVVVTGCAADVDPERLRASVGIDYVVGNVDKPRLVELVLAARERTPQATGLVLGQAIGYAELRSRHPMDREWPDVAASNALGAAAAGALEEADRTRVFLKIQEGCNSFCTYCIIPYGRGPARSLEHEAVIAAVARAVDQGAQEVILTGTNLGDYATDLTDEPLAPGQGFARLVALILARTELPRLRLSSLDPREIRPELLDLMAHEPRLCPHFHVSLQSASDEVLRLMKRAYRVADAERVLGQIADIRGPHGPAFVGMDVITGFPGETAEHFAETLARLERLPWSRLHVFPYSERAGTPATRLPGVVPPAERARRAKLLRELSARRLSERCAQVGEELRGILLEKPDAQGIAGYTPDYLKVRLPLTPGLRRGMTIAARASGFAVDPASGDASFIGQWGHSAHPHS